MTILNLTRDSSGKATFIRRPSVQMFAGSLVTADEQTLTVPSDYHTYNAIFSYSPGASVWVAINNTATFPATTMTSINSEQNPVAYELKAGDVIHFVTPDTGDLVGVALYAII